MSKRGFPFRRKRRRAAGRAAAVLGALVGGALAAAGGWVAYSRYKVNHEVDLPDAIPARRFLFNGQRAGQLNYYMDRQAEGTPLVLVHSVNAAANAYEMRSFFERYHSERPVYALDLPGFGFSDRSDRVYTPELFEGAILDLLEVVVGGPADVVALSLGSEFAARAAVLNPELFRSITMISPTGFGEHSAVTMPEPGSAGPGNGSDAHRVLSNPLWGRPLYDLLTTRPSLRYFLRQSFVGEVPDDFVEYDYASAHQPGAEHAPLYFISGELFTRGVRPAIYERLEMPVLVLYDQDAYTGFEALPEVVEAHPNWRAVRITPTRGLPHFEQPEQTFAALDQFWREMGKRPAEPEPDDGELE